MIVELNGARRRRRERTAQISSLSCSANAHDDVFGRCDQMKRWDRDGYKEGQQHARNQKLDQNLP